MWWLRCRLLLALSLFAAAAFGEPVPGGEVHVERSERAFACPNESELVKATLALGAAPVAPGAAPLAIEVRFDHDPSSYLAVVTTSGQKAGKRELRTSDADCTRLADSVAVVLAVLLDLVPTAAKTAPPGSNEPSAASSGPLAMPDLVSPVAAAPRSAASTAPVTRPPHAAVSPSRAAPPTSTPFSVSIRAEAALAYGFLGGAASPLVGGAVALRRGAFELALGGDWSVPRRVAFEPLPSTSVKVGLAYGFADGCFRISPATTTAWHGSVCARFAAGALAADGRGFDHEFPAHDAWFAAGPLALFRLPLGHVVALRLDALALVLLGHQTLEIQGYGAAFRSSPLAAALTLGPELSNW